MTDKFFSPNERLEILRFIKEQPGSVSNIDIFTFIKNKYPYKRFSSPEQNINFEELFMLDIKEPEKGSLISINYNKTNSCYNKSHDNNFSICYYHTNIEYRKYIDKILEINNYHCLENNQITYYLNNSHEDVANLDNNVIYAVKKAAGVTSDVDTKIYNEIAVFLGKIPDVLLNNEKNTAEIHLNDRCFIPECIGYLVKNYNKDHRLRYLKNNTHKPIFYVGEKTVITDNFFDFKNCVFLSDVVIFDYENTRIKTFMENGKKKIFSFRDAHFNCKRIIFNNLQVYSDENCFGSEISFEDAQFFCDDIIFNKSVFVNTKVNFFQTQFKLNSNTNTNNTKNRLGCIFEECVFKNSYIDFEDSIVNIPLSFRNINDFPNANFIFKSAVYLKLHNCILNNRIKIANTERLSLKNSISSDIIETFPQNCIWKCFSDKDNHCKWINFSNCFAVKAISDNFDSPESKASQLALLKESYHSLGQYEAEDIAFGASRKFGETNRIVKASLWLSNYGTDSEKFFRIIFICVFLVSIVSYLPDIFTVSLSSYEGLLRSFLSAFSDFFLTNYDRCTNILDNIFSAFLGLIGLFAFGYLLTIVIKKLNR